MDPVKVEKLKKKLLKKTITPEMIHMPTPQKEKTGPPIQHAFIPFKKLSKRKGFWDRNLFDRRDMGEPSGSKRRN